MRISRKTASGYVRTISPAPPLRATTRNILSSCSGPQMIVKVSSSRTIRRRKLTSRNPLQQSPRWSTHPSGPEWANRRFRISSVTGFPSRSFALKDSELPGPPRNGAESEPVEALCSQGSLCPIIRLAPPVNCLPGCVSASSRSPRGSLLRFPATDFRMAGRRPIALVA